MGYASFRLSNTLLSFDCQIHGCAVTFTLCLMVLEQLLDLSLMGSGFMCFCFAEHWASDFAFKADHFAREYGDVNPGIPFLPEGGDTANLSVSLRLPFSICGCAV